MKEHRMVQWGRIKHELMKDFREWIKECSHTRKEYPIDMIEYLFQMGYIKGKEWHKYIDEIAKKQDEEIKNGRWPMDRQMFLPMCEGKIDPNEWV